MRSKQKHIDLAEEQKWLVAAKLSSKGFEPIYNRYFEEIFRFIYRRTSSKSLAEDLTSETFYKALKNIRKFRFNGKALGNWLYTIARNQVNSYYRGRNKLFIIEIDEFEKELSTEERQLGYDNEDLIWVLQNISETELLLIELKFFEHKTFREVALLTNMSESAVKMRLYRLLLTMKNKIELRNGRK